MKFKKKLNILMGMMSKKQNVQNWDIRCITIKIGSCDYTNINIYVKELTDVCLFVCLKRREMVKGEGKKKAESLHTSSRDPATGLA